ncbi:hypothetical protein INR49_007286 [Caranx melampygus]|nr:hypothetical protein INR49_007286 [Caranx melampygus]
MSGRVGDLSPKQAECLSEFRRRIQDVLADLPAQHDHYLLRWLRARSFNVQKAEAMIRKHVEFRKQMKVDSIISEWRPPEVIDRYVSGGMCGYDREGSPIWYDVIGPLDPKGLLLSASKQDFIRTKVRHTELLRLECQRQSEKLEKNIESVTLISDCEGLGLKHIWKPAIELYGEILTMFEENYPEGLKRVFLIKAPRMFPVAYNLIKHFLCEETRHKIIVLGNNWQEVLRTHIAPEQLPVVYGGTLTDPNGDPRCQTMVREQMMMMVVMMMMMMVTMMMMMMMWLQIKYGGTVPRSYYLQDSVKVQYDNSVIISRGSVFQLESDVTAAGSLLSDGADIGFGVYRRTTEGGGQKVSDMQQVLPSQRYNAHLVPEDSCLTCPEPGVYVLCFDNSYSFLQSKRVSYKVEVLPPADGQAHSQRSRGDRRLQ